MRESSSRNLAIVCISGPACRSSIRIHMLIYTTLTSMRDEKGRSKQGQTNKAKQHSTPKAAHVHVARCFFFVGGVLNKPCRRFIYNQDMCTGGRKREPLASVCKLHAGSNAQSTTHVACSGVAPEEVETERRAETVVEHSQHVALHVADVLTAVRVVCDVDKVPHLRSVHLLVFAGNQHGRDPHQLQLGLVARL